MNPLSRYIFAIFVSLFSVTLLGEEVDQGVGNWDHTSDLPLLCAKHVPPKDASHFSFDPLYGYFFTSNRHHV